MSQWFHTAGQNGPNFFFFFLHEKSVVQGPVVQSGIKLIHNSITVRYSLS